MTVVMKIALTNEACRIVAQMITLGDVNKTDRIQVIERVSVLLTISDRSLADNKSALILS